MGCGASAPGRTAAYDAAPEPGPKPDAVAEPWREPNTPAAVFVVYHPKEASDEAAFLQAELAKTLR